MMIKANSTPSATILTAAMAMAAPLTADATIITPLIPVDHQPYQYHERRSYIGASWLAVSATDLARRLEVFAAGVIGNADRDPGASAVNFSEGSYAVGVSVSVGSKEASKWINGDKDAASGAQQKIVEQEKNLQIAFAALHSLVPNADHDLLEEAAPFYDLVKDMTWQPEVWSDEGEVAFEWKTPEKHAMVSFDGDGYYGYAMLIDNRFKAGAQEMPMANTIPSDLREYLGVA